MRIVRLLNDGVSVDEVAARQGVTIQRMRAREILAPRAPQPPAEFLALQVSRLNETLFVSYNAASGLGRMLRRIEAAPSLKAAKRRGDPGEHEASSTFPWIASLRSR